MLKNIFVLFILVSSCTCFVPASLMEKAINQVNKFVNFTQASATVTHEEIIKRGIIRSAAKYFYDMSKLNGSTAKIDLNKLVTGE